MSTSHVLEPLVPLFILLAVPANGKATRESEAAHERKFVTKGAAPAGATLQELGSHYGTDKATLSRFVDVYAEVLPGGTARADVHYLLEIGVFFGASLKMWRDYYPAATVIGVDAFKGIEGYAFQGRHQQFKQPRLFLESWRKGDQGERIELIEADEGVLTDMQRARDQVKTILHKQRKDGSSVHGLDILIDDGSHLQLNQQANLGMLFPLVRPGGFYVIEDMHCSFINGYDTKPYPSADTTLALLERFNATGKIQQSFKNIISPHSMHYIERWSAPPVCFVPPGKTRERALTCVLRKLESVQLGE